MATRRWCGPRCWVKRENVLASACSPIQWLQPFAALRPLYRWRLGRGGFQAGVRQLGSLQIDGAETSRSTSWWSRRAKPLTPIQPTDLSQQQGISACVGLARRSFS